MFGGKREKSREYREGGTRGGAAEFKWESVKDDKYRENYLGHSIHAAVGRWQKGRDLQWYSKAKKEDRDKALQDDVLRVKQEEERIMLEELGYIPKQHHVTRELDDEDKKFLMKRGATDRDEADVERVAGLGAAPANYDSASRNALVLSLLNPEDGGDEDVLPGTGLDFYAEPAPGAGAAAGEKPPEKKHKKKSKKKKKKKSKKHSSRHDTPSPSPRRRRHDTPSPSPRRRRHDSPSPSPRRRSSSPGQRRDRDRDRR